jgi:hypothetical protein
MAERDKRSGAPLRKTREIASPITDRFYVRGTFYDAQVSTNLRVDGARGTLPGTSVSAERDLGMASRLTQGRVELMFRLRERNRLRVDFFHTGRYGDQVISRTIQFGDQTFIANDRATTSLDWRMFGLTYTYSIFRRERFEIGAGLGIYLLQGEARGEVPARQLRQEVSGVGAFPTIALDGTWRISQRFALTARGQYLRAAVHNFEGKLGEYHADLQYRWTPNFTVGTGYTAIRPSLDVHNGNSPGLFAFDVKGPELFFRVSF